MLFIIFLSQIYISLGLLFTFTFVCINYIIYIDNKNQFTFREILFFIFLYPIVLHHIFK